MSTYMNELGEFVEPDPPDVDERRRRIYASCVEVDPMKARGPEPKMPVPRKFKEPVICFCAECGASFEKKRRNQMFCCRKCQRANYNTERRERRLRGRR